jgi:hypothetical protein
MVGRGVKQRKPYPYLHEITDRHGQRRVYLRKPGCPSVALPMPPRPTTMASNMTESSVVAREVVR